MNRIDAIKSLEAEIIEIENGPEELVDFFAPGISAWPKEGLNNKLAALEQYKAMTDAHWEKATQFND